MTKCIVANCSNHTDNGRCEKNGLLMEITALKTLLKRYMYES